MLLKLIVCFIAGAGAGLGTGFAGMSAAVVISPMLIAFLGMPAYEAIGIALASDVLASAVSAWTYHRSGNLQIRRALLMMAIILGFTVLGSLVSSRVNSSLMGGLSVFSSFFLGLKFVIWPVKTTKNQMNDISGTRQLVQSILCGIYIGCVCGFIGAGGGIMMLFVLTTFMRYELKTAVGTSVFIMTFTALTGAVSHFAIGGLPDLTVLILCVVFTLVWARFAAVIANKASAKTLNRVIGIVLVVLGIIIIAVTYLF